MNEFNINLILIIISLSVAIMIFKIIITLKKYHRVTKNSLKSHDKKSFIEIISSFLNKIIIFNSLAEKYDKYLSPSNKILKKGMDVVSIKIILFIISVLAYTIISLIIKRIISPYVIILNLIITFCIPDIVIYYKSKKNNLIEEKFLNLIIEIGKKINGGKNLEQAIDEFEKNDPIIKKELSTIKNDLKVGLSLAESIKKASKKLKSEILYEIYVVLNQSINGVDNELLFDMVESTINNYKNQKKETEMVISEKKNFAYTMSFVPFTVIVVFTILLYPQINNIEIILILYLLETLIYMAYLVLNSYFIKYKPNQKNINKEIEYLFQTILINLKKDNNLKKAFISSVNTLDNKLTSYIKEYINIVKYESMYLNLLNKVGKKINQTEIKNTIRFITKSENENNVDLIELGEKINKIKEQNFKYTLRKIRNMKIAILLNTVIVSVIMIVPIIIIAK